MGLESVTQWHLSCDLLAPTGRIAAPKTCRWERKRDIREALSLEVGPSLGAQSWTPTEILPLPWEQPTFYRRRQNGGGTWSKTFRKEREKPAHRGIRIAQPYRQPKDCYWPPEHAGSMVSSQHHPMHTASPAAVSQPALQGQECCCTSNLHIPARPDPAQRGWGGVTEGSCIEQRLRHTGYPGLS